MHWSQIILYARFSSVGQKHGTSLQRQLEAGRSTQDLLNILATLDERGVGFRCLSQSGVDTTTSTGKLTLAILGAVAAFETDLRAERQAEGIARAKKIEGKYRGRAPSIDYAQVRKLHSQGISPTEIASLLKIGRTSVYRALSA